MTSRASMLSWALLCCTVSAATRTSARTWRPSMGQFVFPEDDWSEVLAQHLGGKDFGVALAGGGTRGMALGHGILRSLRESGHKICHRFEWSVEGGIDVPQWYCILSFLYDLLCIKVMSPNILGRHWCPKKTTKRQPGSFRTARKSKVLECDLRLSVVRRRKNVTVRLREYSPQVCKKIVKNVQV